MYGLVIALQILAETAPLDFHADVVMNNCSMLALDNVLFTIQNNAELN